MLESICRERDPVMNDSIKYGLTLSQTTNFRLFQIQRVCRLTDFAGNNFKFDENEKKKKKKILDRDRKHCGKRRNCSFRAISPFPTVFSKDLYCRHVKTTACLGKDELS